MLFLLAAVLCAREIQRTERTVQKRFARRAAAATMGLACVHHKAGCIHSSIASCLWIRYDMIQRAI